MTGHHTIWDIYDCDISTIELVAPIKDILNTIVSEIQLTKVSESYKQFEPYGASGFILLEESHISIHTWPEHRFAAIDVFSCKEFDVEKINILLKSCFKTETIETKVINRGWVAEIK